MSDDDLQRWERLCEAATPPPWFLRPGEYDDWGLVRDADGVPVCSTETPARWKPSDCGKHEAPSPIDENGAFVAESRTALPLLIAEVRRLRADSARLTAKCDQQQRDIMELRTELSRSTVE